MNGTTRLPLTHGRSKDALSSALWYRSEILPGKLRPVALAIRHSCFGGQNQVVPPGAARTTGYRYTTALVTMILSGRERYELS